jgi:pilus assembly protein Flp/PilA
MRILKFIRCLLRDNRATTAIEYGLILALMCLAIMVSLRSVADENNDMWARITNTIAAAMGA